MGFYDHEYGEDPTAKKQKGNRSGWFLAGLVGAIIGMLVFMFSMPFLSQFLPYDMANANENVSGENGNDYDVQETVDVDVNSSVIDAVDKVSDAVVGVINLKSANFLDNEYTQEGMGSGVIYKKEDGSAYVVTNNHVIEGAGEIEVRLGEDEKVQAEVVGSDKWMDLAVLRIDGSSVKTVAKFGNSNDLKRGEPAIAIGNPLGFNQTVTKGIISGTNRTIPLDINGDKRPDWQAEVIQTDAAINPGNSGGALINIQGQVVGINSLKIAQTAVESIGFAIPINQVKPIIQEIEQNGEVQRPYMGIYPESLSTYPEEIWSNRLNLPEDVTSGVVVTEVAPSSPAFRAGLKPGDVITAFNGEEIKNSLELRKYLFTKTEIGEDIEVTFYRQGEKETMTLTLAPLQQ
jgi:serine protease Do